MAYFERFRKSHPSEVVVPQDAINHTISRVQNPRRKDAIRVADSLGFRRELNPEASETQIFVSSLLGSIHAGDAEGTIALLDYTNANVSRRLKFLKMAKQQEVNLFRSIPMIEDHTRANIIESEIPIIEKAQEFVLQKEETSPQFDVHSQNPVIRLSPSLAED